MNNRCVHCDKELLWYDGWKAYGTEGDKSITSFVCEYGKIQHDFAPVSSYWSCPKHEIKEDKILQILKEVDSQPDK